MIHYIALTHLCVTSVSVMHTVGSTEAKALGQMVSQATHCMDSQPPALSSQLPPAALKILALGAENSKLVHIINVSPMLLHGS